MGSQGPVRSALAPDTVCLGGSGGGVTTVGTRVALASCSGAPTFTLTRAGELKVGGNCVAVVAKDGGGVDDAIIGTCTGRPDQQWKFSGEGALRHVASNRVLDVPYSSTRKGTTVNAYPLHGSENQRWAF